MTRSPDRGEIEAAAQVLRAGGIVCFPTETMYGLAVDIRHPGALGRLVAVKGRDPTAPFGLIVRDADSAKRLAAVWPEAAERLARAHWPGALTLVVPAADDLPPELVGPGGGVGVRVSSHPWAAALASAAGGVITATSANPSGSPAALDAEQARAYFGDRVDLYIDLGPAASEVPSTVVEIDRTGAVIVRRSGAISISIESL